MSHSTAKHANTVHPVNELIRSRWSARAFTNDAITQDEMNTLLEAASWAASAGNEQPWQFVYSFRHEEDSHHNRFADFLLPGNRPWAQNAAAFIVVLANKTFAQNGNPNHYALHDAGQATANLLLQAASMHISGHVMAGIDKVKIREDLNIPENVEVVSMIALGKVAPAEVLDEPYKSRELSPRSRKSISDISFKNNLPTL